MSTRISGTAANRREHARQGDGRFGQQEYARANGIDLEGEGDLSAPNDAEAGGAPDVEAWYDASSGETVIETSSWVDVSEVIGVLESDPRFEEGSQVLHSVLESRHLDAVVNASHADWEVHFTTRVRGQMTEQEVVEDMGANPRGAYALRADLDARRGESDLRGAFLRGVRGSVVLPDLGEVPEVADGSEYRAYREGEEVAPPSDELASTYADELSIDGVEISRLALEGVASADELDYELSMCPRDQSRMAFRAHQLRRWAAIRHAETMRRWS